MKTYQDLETENLVLREQLKLKDERLQSLVKSIEGLTNLANRLLSGFKKTESK